MRDAYERRRALRPTSVALPASVSVEHRAPRETHDGNLFSKGGEEKKEEKKIIGRDCSLMTGNAKKRKLKKKYGNTNIG